MWEFFNHSKSIQKQLDARWHRLYRLAYSWCHDPHLAKDLAQDAIVKALKSRNTLKDEKSLDAWLFSILNNCWKDYWRSKKEMLDIDSMTLEIEGDHSVALEKEDAIASVRRAISKLPVNQVQVITLVDLEEMGYQEVATILGIPIGTVMSRLCRARKSLKTILISGEDSTGLKNSTLRCVK